MRDISWTVSPIPGESWTLYGDYKVTRRHDCTVVERMSWESGLPMSFTAEYCDSPAVAFDYIDVKAGLW